MLVVGRECSRRRQTSAAITQLVSTLPSSTPFSSLVESGRVAYVVFLDFKAAFDVVDHALLLDILRRRDCPPSMQSLIASLTFHHIRSRIVSDGETSDWFSRSKGVLQGSPLSPYLFNIFVDGLLEDLNDGATAVPRSLFYADDGTLLASSSFEIQRLLDIVAAWSARHRMTLNVKKCGYIAPPEDEASVHLGGKKLSRLQEYSYLGFPMTRTGIDFRKHLNKRLEQACGRATFISLHSDRWGPAHRLRIYRQYLAPMFEYGAPLVTSYTERCSKIWKVAEVRRARELQDAKEAAKERGALGEASRAEARAIAKVQKELEARQKREERVARAEAKKAEVALKKAQREQAREAKQAEKQLQIDSMARRKCQKDKSAKRVPSKTSASTTVGLSEEMMPVRPKSRGGRIIRRPARFDE